VFLYVILAFVLLVNIFGFILMGIDKHKAKKRLWRIPEKAFFTVAVLGGAAGVYAGMLFFKHKTKHWYFMLGIPAILLLEVLVTLFFIKSQL
jgi:uncharacterized membrane protein YsdA (DUF1294 family)